MLLLLVPLLKKGWWDCLLLVLAVAMLTGSYEIRRRARLRTDTQLRSRRAESPAGSGGSIR